jgi:hypothetical protein
MRPVTPARYQCRPIPFDGCQETRKASLVYTPGVSRCLVVIGEQHSDAILLFAIRETHFLCQSFHDFYLSID